MEAAIKNSDHNQIEFLKRREVTDVNQVWMADIICIHIPTVFFPLDVFSLRMAGWALDKRINHYLVLEALHMAIRRATPRPA